MQFRLFVAPVLVLLGYVIGPTPMNLQFRPGAVIMMLVATLTAIFLAVGGRSAWFVGALAPMACLVFAMRLTVMRPQAAGFLPVAIRAFNCSETEALFGLRRVARFANIEHPALRKLKQFDLARGLEDLRALPAIRLEQMKGDRAGRWSIRVNERFRICFRWTVTDAEDVEIVDCLWGRST